MTSKIINSAFKKISKECVQKKYPKSVFKKYPKARSKKLSKECVQKKLSKERVQKISKDKFTKSAFKIYSFQIFNCMNKSQWEILYILIIYLVYFYNLEIFGYSEFGF